MAVTIQGLVVVAKFLDVNGPSGTYSHFCTSRALQSFMRTYPNIRPRASSAVMGLPIVPPPPSPSAYSTFVGPPTMNATSSSKSSDLVGPYLLPFLGSAGSIMT